MARPKKPRRTDVDDDLPQVRTTTSRGHIFEIHPHEEFLRPLKRWAARSVAGHARSVDHGR